MLLIGVSIVIRVPFVASKVTFRVCSFVYVLHVYVL